MHNGQGRLANEEFLARESCQPSDTKGVVMFSSNVGKIGAGLVVSLLACASASAATIKIAVAANFATPLNEVIAGFKAANPAYAGYTYQVTSGATGDFAAAIQTDINDGSISTYDIFIA